MYYYAELINGLQPWNLGGAETPLSDPFLDLNLFLDSGVEAFPHNSVQESERFPVKIQSKVE